MHDVLERIVLPGRRETRTAETGMVGVEDHGVPAGVGHECLNASATFLVVGAYPPVGTYSECRGSFQEYEEGLRAVRRSRKWTRDPLMGRG